MQTCIILNLKKRQRLLRDQIKPVGQSPAGFVFR